MHLVFYGRNILDLHGLSTPLSVAVFVGAGWGLIRLVGDIVHLATGGRLYPDRARREPKIRPGPDS